MRKLLLLFALIGTLAALLPVTALGSPGKSSDNRADTTIICTNGHGFSVWKDDDGSCPGDE